MNALLQQLFMIKKLRMVRPPHARVPAGRV
jgi:hypothetical protein